MSHFYCWILVPQEEFLTPNDPTERYAWATIMEDYIKSYIATKMHRYDENQEVPEYEEDCWCVNRAAKRDARTKADEVLAIDDARKIFKTRAAEELPEVHAKIEQDGHGFGLNDDQDHQHEQLWREILKPRKEAEQAFCKAHAMYQKPDSDCGDCNGTGRCTTTYNPESKWDWYRVGGRWDGEIQRNRRRSQNGFNFGDQHTTLANNVMTVERLLQDWQPENAPLAILTPDGEWHERGTMGWFGLFQCDPHAPDQWREAAKKILEMNRNCLAVGIDCHI